MDAVTPTNGGLVGGSIIPVDISGGTPFQVMRLDWASYDCWLVV
jgi:mannose/fructose-specific phosphotransferase system component IIA